MKPMELTLELWGDEPNQMDAILEEFYNRTKGHPEPEVEYQLDSDVPIIST